jgi:hypothetical protein
MDDAKSSPPIEDLELDSSAAESVKGGLTHKQRQAEIARLEKQGYVNVSCEPQGDVYLNSKTHKTKIVPYAH